MKRAIIVLLHENGRAYHCGTQAFRRRWQRWLNESPDETLEAYFRQQWEKEHRAEFERQFESGETY